MHSLESVTDFDTDDDEYPANDGDYIVYSSSSSGNGSNISDNDTTSCGDSVTVSSRACRVREFGDFEENYGWIQCRSKSFPDRTYYYNTRSGCSTWCRPVSRFIDLPFVSIKRVNYADNVLESTTDLELMTVSDDEKENTSERGLRHGDLAKSLIGISDVIKRYYNAPEIGETLDANNTNSSVDERADERREEWQRTGDENNDAEDAAGSPLYAANFLETELFVGKDTVDTEGSSRIFSSPLMKENARLSSTRCGSVLYGVPRLKRIKLESQLVKQRRTRVTRVPAGPRRIISDMYGVRTISYDLPESDQACKVKWFTTTTLSASDSDSGASVLHSPSRRETKTPWSFKFDIGRNLRQPLLSESSSSPSSRSDTSSNSSSSCSCSCSSSSSSNSSSSSSSNSSSSSSSSPGPSSRLSTRKI
ncbi:hypothetical protein PUN28_019649 [Cardiocondyla obscurior]|uniref:WW domain-containing protein n=1 Tax=Cardiocondyla obscurior TaxID=286306 RepID=A0AAW2EDR5_9HYME